MVDATIWDEGQPHKPEQTCQVQRGSWRTKCAGPVTSVPNGAPMARLVSTIEGEIIPRLLLALQSAPALRGRTDGLAVSDASGEDVTEFARLVATHDVTVASAYVRALLNRGVSLEKIYLELLAPAARLLGEWWKEDLRDFTEVTSGLCRMHQLLHEFSETFLHDARATSPARRALLVPMPGEQHSFGLIMVAEFFRRAGWDVWDLHPSKPEDLLAMVQKQSFTLLGISLSCASRLQELPELISAVRKRSRNGSLGVMVGGQPFIEHSARVAEVGADCTAIDGRRAAIEASRLVTALNHPT